MGQLANKLWGLGEYYEVQGKRCISYMDAATSVNCTTICTRAQFLSDGLICLRSPIVPNWGRAERDPCPGTWRFWDEVKITDDGTPISKRLPMVWHAIILCVGALPLGY